MKSIDQQGCGPSDLVPVIDRHEILEERGNRDAFRLCVLLLVVMAIGLVVLGIALVNTSIVLIPHAAESELPSFTPRTPIDLPASRKAAGGERKQSAARLGVGVPRTHFVWPSASALGSVPVQASGRVLSIGAKSDAGDVGAQSCRPECYFFYHPMRSPAARSCAHRIRDGRERGSNVDANA